MNSSWALIVDLGYQIPTSQLSALLEAFWSSPEVGGPHLKIGSFRTLPQASEGHLNISALAGKSYTKLEADNMGYPQGWPATVLLTLSLYDFPGPVKSSPELLAFLIQQAHQWYTLFNYRMAVIADTSIYYVNADFINSAWLNWQQEAVSHMLLPDKHPLTQSLTSESSTAALRCYGQSELRQYWHQAPEKIRYQAFQSTLRQQSRPEGLRLDWESG